MVIALVLLGGVHGVAGEEKKLIHFGWDLKNLSELAKEIDRLQHNPFDGLLIKSAWCYPFYSKGVGDPANNIQLAKNIKWGRFTDNFMYLTAGKKIDWFDDSLWTDDSDLIKNVRAIAKLGAAAGCKGVFFEPEFVYWGAGDNTWNYASQKRKDEKTFAEFEEMVRRRGRQFIDVIEEFMPKTVFLTAFWGSQSSYIKAGKEAAMRNDPKLYVEILSGEHYGLLDAFMCGVLEGADPGTTIVDGNEHAYYNSDAFHYMYQAKIIRNHLEHVPPELQLKYAKQVEVGHAIYADNLSNTFYQHCSSTYLTPAERAQWMEHNVYWALMSSDHYVWFYSERVHYLRGQGVAPEMIPAIQRASDKVGAGETLGYSMRDIMEKAGQGYRNAQYAPIATATAAIGRCQGGITVDSSLNDAGWQGTTALEAFKSFRTSVVQNPYGTTKALATYDDQNLYFRVICAEPSGVFHATKYLDYSCKFGKSDQVDFVIDTGEPGKYYHFMVTTDGSTWDALTDMAIKDYAGEETYGFDSSWSGPFQHAVKIADDKSKYTVEIAIPWKTIGKNAPKPGDTLKGNILRWRHRNRDGFIEFSSWSQHRNRREVEMKQFGTWTFN
jgi:hypothetical protein